MSETASPSGSSGPLSSESAYSELRRLIPSLADELEGLRTALREHNVWIQRYGHQASSNQHVSPTSNSAPPAAPSEPCLPSNTATDLPAYSAPDVPPYTPGLQSTTSEVLERRDQIMEWLREGEDVLREYSARFAQIGEELGMPFDDVLGTWAASAVDNSLPDYEQVEEREELMVGGVGEVPPPYVGAAPVSEKGR